MNNLLYVHFSESKYFTAHFSISNAFGACKNELRFHFVVKSKWFILLTSQEIWILSPILKPNAIENLIVIVKGSKKEYIEQEKRKI